VKVTFYSNSFPSFLNDDDDDNNNNNNNTDDEKLLMLKKTIFHSLLYLHTYEEESLQKKKTP
jgi:hypothetical protein